MWFSSLIHREKARPAPGHIGARQPAHTRSDKVVKSQFVFLRTGIIPRALQAAVCLFVPSTSKPPTWGNSKAAGELQSMKLV